jgi:ADP-heptose:LPS heptosyltransferase
MKRLIFRLSSLGDLVLAQSALESPHTGETHWIVAQEFAPLLEGHPKIRRVWTFDRRRNPGLKAWLRMLDVLFLEEFTEVLDLHSTLRTRVARLYFIFKSLTSRRALPRWRTLSKERFRRLGYVLFKRYWPSILRPRHLSEKSAKLAGGSGKERPDLGWLVRGKSAFASRPEVETQIAGAVVVVGIAPSSAWPGKEWPVHHYCDLAAELEKLPLRYLPVILGTASDRAAGTLRNALRLQGRTFVDLIGKQTLPEVAATLSRCDVVIGPDTGLLHIAEAVGTRVIAIYGPTRVDFGFGVSREDSTAIHGPVGCSPCSKDGTLCHRFGDRYACLRKLDAAEVLQAIKRVAQSKNSASKASLRETGPA